jgi:hypothetical protein
LNKYKSYAEKGMRTYAIRKSQTQANRLPATEPAASKITSQESNSDILAGSSQLGSVAPKPPLLAVKANQFFKSRAPRLSGSGPMISSTPISSVLKSGSKKRDSIFNFDK